MSLYPDPRPSTLGLVPSGDAGVAATLKMMVGLTREYRKDAGVRQRAASLVKDLAQYDTMGSIRAVHAFVRDSIRYTPDIRTVELLQTPRATLEMEVGDCDDKSTVLASLLESIGLATRFVAIALGANRSFSHVLVEVRIGKGWLPLETIKDVSPGWYPKGVTRRMVYNV